MNNNTLLEISAECSGETVNLSKTCVELDPIPTCCFPNFSLAFVLFASVYYVIVSVIGSLGNLLNIIVLSYAWLCRYSDSYSHGRSFNTLLLISYSVSEFTYCSFSLVLIAMTYINRGWRYGNTLCIIQAYLRQALGMTSWSTVTTMIFSSALHLWIPTVYQVIFRTMGGLPAIACLWIISWMTCLILFADGEVTFGYNYVIGQCMIIPGQSKLASVVVGLLDIFPFFVTIISFIFLWIKMWCSRKTVASFGEVGHSTVEQLLIRERRTAVLFAALALSFLLPVLPAIILVFCCWTNSYAVYFAYVHALAMSHVIIDFWVYFMRVNYYRSAIKFFLNDTKRRFRNFISTQTDDS